jgi:hypothetical protein
MLPRVSERSKVFERIHLDTVASQRVVRAPIHLKS